MSGDNIFISYSGAQRPWAEVLASNLLAAGKEVFFDRWNLIPGTHWVQELANAIDDCAAAVLIVSPEAYESGWIKDEYEKLKSRSNDGSDFAIIPVIHSGVEAELPFIGNIQWVDFREPHDYRAAFERLLCGLERRAPGERPYYAGALTEPPQPRASAPKPPPRSLQDMRNLLVRSRMAIVLTAVGLSLAEVARDLAEFIQQRNGSENVAHIATPYAASDADDALFFADIAQQLGASDAIRSLDGVKAYLEERLRGGPLFLIVTNFEHARSDHQASLAGLFRSLVDRFANMHLLVFGGERLCEQKYANNHMSFLNTAEEMFWPEPDVATIGAAVAGEEDRFSADDLVLVAEASGGHPMIARELLKAILQGVRGDLDHLVEASPAIWSALTPVARDDRMMDQLAAMVDRDDLGLAVSYPPQPLRRRLRWQGLLAEGARSRLIWRSDAIRGAVRTFIAETRA